MTKIEIIKLQGTEGKLIKAISVKRNIPQDAVVRMLRYNILTPNQLAALTGYPLSQIMNMCREGKKSGKTIPAKLLRVGVMPEWEDEAETPGRLFIFRDERMEKLLLDSVTD